MPFLSNGSVNMFPWEQTTKQEYGNGVFVWYVPRRQPVQLSSATEVEKKT
jgi:hypothetical protein